jgi:hypothetical protein
MVIWRGLAGLAALLLAAAPAGAEERCRAVLWPAPGASVPAVGEASARLEPGCAVLPLPEPAAPGPTPEAGRLRAAASARLESAQDRYYEADFGGAAEILDDVIGGVAAELALHGALDVLGSLLVWRGASLAKLGRADEAASSFAFALSVGVQEIDRALFPPDVTRAFDAAREGRRSGAATALSLASTPSGAALEVDGVAREVAGEAGLEVATGLHVVVARRPGYRPAAQVVSVGAEGAALSIPLEPTDAAEAARQVAALRRDGALDAADETHRALVASALDADLLLLVLPSGEATLLTAAGDPAAWPEDPDAAEAGTPPGGGGPAGPGPAPVERRPVWREWWFWLALVGGAAAASTAVGLGVFYGTQERDTFTLVPARRPAPP